MAQGQRPEREGRDVGILLSRGSKIESPRAPELASALILERHSSDTTEPRPVLAFWKRESEHLDTWVL